ncbi:hypothetical protein ACFPRL_03190 [Pseudoclavibacter helvolus]
MEHTPRRAEATPPEERDEEVRAHEARENAGRGLQHLLDGLPWGVFVDGPEVTLGDRLDFAPGAGAESEEEPLHDVSLTKEGSNSSRGECPDFLGRALGTEAPEGVGVPDELHVE